MTTMSSRRGLSITKFSRRLRQFLVQLDSRARRRPVFFSCTLLLIILLSVYRIGLKRTDTGFDLLSSPSPSSSSSTSSRYDCVKMNERLIIIYSFSYLLLFDGWLESEINTAGMDILWSSILGSDIPFSNALLLIMPHAGELMQYMLCGVKRSFHQTV